MFLRSNNCKKDGKDRRSFRIVENHRIASHKTVQRTILYLGEINDQQQAEWRKTPSVFDEQQQEYANLNSFPDDREIPADAVDSLQVKMSGLELRRPRVFGSCWLACELWHQLGLHEFWDARLSGSREGVAWEKVHRVDAHILIAFLAYCLQVTLKHRLLLHAPGLTPTAVLQKLA
jgi:hypothetical protein